jgi:hypothetical protein
MNDDANLSPSSQLTIKQLSLTSSYAKDDKICQQQRAGDYPLCNLV